MRACEGCRKRKIKCDGATTSNWPCGSCTRLKQKCNPPVVNLDRSVAGGNHIPGLERVLNFDEESGSGEDDDYLYGDGGLYDDFGPPDTMQLPQRQFNAGIGPFSTPPYTESNTSHQDFSFNSVPPVHLNLQNASFHDQTTFPPLSASLAPSEASNWSNDQYSQHTQDISDALGELKINDNGVGGLLVLDVFHLDHVTD